MHEKQGRILIVDDDPAMCRLLAAVLDKDYRVAMVGDGESALDLMADFAPSLVLLDLILPGIDGLETCRRIRMSPGGHDVHVVMISSRSSRREQSRAFAAGADDYVVKPIEPHEFSARIQLHFRLRTAAADMVAARAELDAMAMDMDRLAAARDGQVHATQDAAVLALAKVAECRDDQTGDHLVRIRSYSQILAERLSREGPYRDQIDESFLADLYRSSLLHDIGKVGIPDAILLKPGPLTAEEFEQMKQHTTLGANVLEMVVLYSAAASFLSMAAVIARFHHERFDGTGYPAHLAGQAIPLPARIVALTDVYDALTSKRPYKDAWKPEEAFEAIRWQAGRHFDPAVVAAFEAGFDDFLAVRASDELEIRAGVASAGIVAMDVLSPASESLANT